MKINGHGATVRAAAQPMEAAGIAADVDCPLMAHRRGYILVTEWRAVGH